MTNPEVAEKLERIADLMEIQKGDPFKIRSYRMAAETVISLQTPLSELVAEGGAAELKKLPGIGDAISKRIFDLMETGTTQVYEDLRKETPETLLDLLKISGIGLKTLELLYREFKISSLDDLAEFVKGGGLAGVPRLGQKTQERIKRSLEKRGYQF